MRSTTKLTVALTMLVTAVPMTTRAEDSVSNSILESIDISTLWYLHGRYDGDQEALDFRIGRGYLTTDIKPLAWFEARVTMDTHQDESGDFKVRLKYLHAKLKVPVETDVVSEPYLEFGLVHGPWLDYEEHINLYRMQGTMFMERNGLFNSADLGVTAVVLLGRKLDKEYQDAVSKAYPGTWGSLALGVYNGGGYHALEENDDKVFEARLSVRPLGQLLPNLQLSGLVIYGAGNVESEPDWHNYAGMLSFEHQWFTIAAQFATGKGNKEGKMIDAKGNSIDFNGFSVLGELKVAPIDSSLVARYDWFDWNTDDDTGVIQRIIGGLAYRFYKQNTLLLDLDYAMHEEEGVEDEWQLTLTLQVKL